MQRRRSLSGEAIVRRPSPAAGSDYHCAHSVVIDAGGWGENVRLSDLVPKFICQVCGHPGANIRPPFEKAPMGKIDQPFDAAQRNGPSQGHWGPGPQGMRQCREMFGTST